jgi:hypothetical protein
MDETVHRRWDIVLRSVGMIGLAIGGGVTIWEYFDGVKRAGDTAYRESIKPFLSQRQDLYGQATQVVADLAVGKDPHVQKKSEDAFWKLYWSPLASVESPKIESLMVQFGQCLKSDCDEERKKTLSLKLAQEVRRENEAGFSVALPPVRQ